MRKRLLKKTVAEKVKAVIDAEIAFINSDIYRNYRKVFLKPIIYVEDCHRWREIIMDYARIITNRIPNLENEAFLITINHKGQDPRSFGDVYETVDDLIEVIADWFILRGKAIWYQKLCMHDHPTQINADEHLRKTKICGANVNMYTKLENTFYFDPKNTVICFKKIESNIDYCIDYLIADEYAKQ